jgi:hypothetical protein
MTATELDRLDPAPPPPKAPRRNRKIELAVGKDLRAMPAALRQSALAATALDLARDLDAGGMTPRDKAGHARELRMHMNDLTAMAPGERKGDATDEVRARRERRMEADRQAGEA